VTHALVTHGLVTHALVTHGLVTHGLLTHGLVTHGLVTHHSLVTCRLALPVKLNLRMSYYLAAQVLETSLFCELVRVHLLRVGKSRKH
jgi:hypothetical protein